MCIVNVYLSRLLKRIRPNLTARGQTAMLQNSDHLSARRPAGRAEVFKKKGQKKRRKTPRKADREQPPTRLHITSGTACHFLVKNNAHLSILRERVRSPPVPRSLIEVRASFHPGRTSEEGGVVGARNFLKRKEAEERDQC